MKRPDFALSEAVAWFMADKPLDGNGIEPSTMNRYGRILKLFLAWLPEDERVLASLTIENAERFVRTAPNLNTRRNLAITLRSFATYLCRKKLWYAGDIDTRLSVLRELVIPDTTARGLPPYKDHEVNAILRAVADGSTAIRDRAIIAVELHGFRAKETRMMLLRNVQFPKSGTAGHFLIEDEAATKAGTGGIRIVPMDPATIQPIRAYLRDRPAFKGHGEEPLFLTIKGTAICESTWGTLAESMKKRIAVEGIAFKQHRLRSTSVAQKSESGWSDSAIIEVHGWDRSNKGSGMRMLRRYRGEIPLSQLAKLPMTLGQFFKAS